MSKDGYPKPQTSVALRYTGKGAPRITAKGSGEIGERIIELAREHGIPIHEDAQLVQLLAQVDLGEEIPEALYLAVAKVIAFAYLISGKPPPQPEKNQPDQTER